MKRIFLLLWMTASHLSQWNELWNYEPLYTFNKYLC